MKKLIYSFVCLICTFIVIPEDVACQVSIPVSANGQVYAEIISAFTASESTPMNFGRFSPGPQGGKIILSPQSTISVVGSVYQGTGNHNAASFYVTGGLDASYSITLPYEPVRLTNVTNSKTMLVEDWTSIPSAGTGTGRLQDGFQIVYVGATLNVGTLNDNPVGVYLGSYTVTFDFN